MNGLKSATLWIVIFLVFILMWVQYSDKEQPQKIDLTQVTQLAQSGKITGKVTDKEGRLEGTYTNDEGKPQSFTAEYLPGEGQGGRVYDLFEDNSIAYEVKRTSPFFTQILFSLVLPLIIFVGLWFLIMRQIQGSGNKAMSFGKSRAKLMTGDQTKVTFADVAGVDEAKQELCEVVDFLRDPQKFSRLGGKIPKGVLLVGPPGTGKTLLAKAVAGEASVPFFSISGSDFVEMFVGVGASRVRDLFEQGKKHKPCLIFMDEIDAVGRHRGFGIGGGHDEREQTLNQLLVEMDGFNSNEGIILIASTNRPDVLDPALLRPGRFDRQVTVDYPDLNGREQILAVHARGAKLNRDVNLKVIAKGTPGFSGADLANLINEAALLAARRNRDDVGMAELEEAKDRVMMGPERRSLALTDSEKKLTAYHEAGHAITAKFVTSEEEVHKVTIIPRGRALGVTSYLPSEERFTLFKSKLKDRLVYMLGGRAAEEIIFGDFTTGAGNDLMRTTQMAHRMVCEFGMSDVLGARTYGDSNAPPVFLGRDSGGSDRGYSEATAAVIDSEIKAIVDEAHRRALEILGENKDLLIRVSEALIERETLTGDDIDILMRGETLPDLPTPDPTPPPTATPPPEEKKRKEPRLFGKPILDRPKEQPSS
ncbi:cell division protein FtsH [candidate division BRC1 bacterium HGW-BRC1-1]|jgi:cell division protease FtsH|nr:MAG: cell division protein FtsH [candidate division BRC1 bacterium HGW-BRC1-1]